LAKGPPALRAAPEERVGKKLNARVVGIKRARKAERSRTKGFRRLLLQGMAMIDFDAAGRALPLCKRDYAECERT